MSVDRCSVAGKSLDVGEDFDVVVIGAGPAGVAAAIEAKKHDLSVLLVDENPVSFEDMVETIPLHFGGRMSEIVRNRTAMMEAMIANRPDIVEAFEANVEVRLSTACLGLHVNQANLHWMDGNIAALVDPERGSYLVRFRQAIVATGRRDMGLAFPGWEQQGVMGATAAYSLAQTYQALDARRALVLGSTTEALLNTLSLSRAGVEIVAVIEASSQAACAADLEKTLNDKGIPLFVDATVAQALGNATTGITKVRLTSGHEFEADTIIIAIGAIPMVDVLGAAGCRLVFDEKRGGYVPETNTRFQTSIPSIRAAGDCFGIWPEKAIDPAISREEGRAAARAAVADFGISVGQPDLPDPVSQFRTEFSLDLYRKAWVSKTIMDGDGEVHVCQCEEVSAREILGVEPPRYLNWEKRKNRTCALKELVENAPPHPDQIKRLTRAGMGPCQGRRCREQVQTMLAIESQCPVNQIALASYRAPVRPVSLALAAPAVEVEDPMMRELWDSWFGMPRQWIPFWSVDEEYTVASLANVKEHVVE